VNSRNGCKLTVPDGPRKMNTFAAAGEDKALRLYFKSDSLSPVCIAAGRGSYCSLTGAASLCYARTLLDARPCMLPRLLGARTLSSFFLSRQAVWKQAGSVERLSLVFRCTVRRLLRCRAPVCLQKADITLCDVFGNTALDDALRHDQLAVGAFPSHRSPRSLFDRYVCHVQTMRDA